MKKLYTIFTIILFAHFSYSQTPNTKRYIPYFRSLNASKLAQRITKNIKDDSLKVVAIHYWMTHHIKYDVKKYLAFDYTKVSTKKILRRRKAICTGYSDLFNELCAHAGITSTGVPGYTRNGSTDLFDKFYIDDHIWNAVEINNRWYLLDIGWDAGYVKLYKKTLRGVFVYIFTGGQYTILKYKPRFIKRPVNDYFLRDGKYFMTDHIPSDPLWQVMSPTKTIEEVEADSSFYLRKYTASEDHTGEYMNGDRIRQTNLNEVDRLIEDGFRTNDFNYKNHYAPGISCYLQSMKIAQYIDMNTTDTLAMLEKCDSITDRLNQAIIHFDSNAHYLAQYKTELLNNNSTKKNVMNEHNKIFANANKFALKHIVSGQKTMNEAQKKVKEIKKNIRQQLYTIIHQEKFKNIKSPKKTNTIDSALAASKIKAFIDTIEIRNNEITSKFNRFDSIYSGIIEHISGYANGLNTNRYRLKGLFTLRLYSEDDLDLYIRQLKDSMLLHMPTDDSLWIDIHKGALLPYYKSEFGSIKSHLTNLYKAHKSLGDEYVKMYKSCKDPGNYFNDYLKNIQTYQNELVKYDQSMSNHYARFSQLKSICKNLKGAANKEKKAIKREKLVEEQLYKARNSHIKQHNQSYSRVNNNQKKECIKILGKLKKIKSKFEKKSQ